MAMYHSVDIGPLHLAGNLFLAPVAGWSDRAFRSICTDYGASFTCTEMVSAEAIVRGNQKTSCLMRRAPNERAMAVQLFGGNPQVMGKAAFIVLSQDDRETVPNAIDINCGCPVPKIVKNGAGSALMRDSQRLGEVVRAIVSAASAPIPVTVKIRKGWDDSSTPSLWQSCVKAALDAGAQAITMHPRTRAQGYEGKADWQTLAALCHYVGGAVPVFGSGDLFLAEDAKRMIEQTGVDGVMFARGAMGNPFIFSEARALLCGGEHPTPRCGSSYSGTTGAGAPYSPPTSGERIAAGFKELSLLAIDAGEKNAVRIMRKRFCAYTKGIQGGAELRAAVVHAETIEEYKAIFKPYAELGVSG